jgi:hypothetical protein
MASARVRKRRRNQDVASDSEEDDTEAVAHREAGTISGIYVENFMCHKKFECFFVRLMSPAFEIDLFFRTLE